MILLRYGIRCIMHYSVPVTLGLLAWNGSWQSVSSQLLSDSAGNSGKAAASGSETIAAKNSENSQSESDNDAAIPKTDRPGSESIAMNPASPESNPRGLAIPRADARGRNETAAATNGRHGFSGPSERSETDSDRAPRDRNIDATGHETPLAAASQATLASTNDPVENQVAATSIAADDHPPAAKTDAASEPDDATIAPQKFGVAKNPDSANPSEIAANQVPTERERISKPAKERVSADETKGTAPESNLAESAPASDHGIEPADLKPEVRAIAAEVPSHGNEPKPETRLAAAGEPATAEAKAGAGPNRTGAKPAITETPRVASADPVPSVSKTEPDKAAIHGSERASNVAEPNELIAERKPDTLPDIVVAETGETWRRIAARVYGDETMAEAIWKENRDAHGGSSDSPPVAGRLVRLPSVSPGGGIRKAGTRLARTAR